MRKAMDYLPRRAADLVIEALTDTRVVVVNGARQVGKSTLAERVLRQTEGGMPAFSTTRVRERPRRRTLSGSSVTIG